MSIKYKQLEGMKANAWKHDARRTDESVKFCPTCKKCYETFEHQPWNNKKFMFLSNFPSYKKPRIICPQCTRSINDNNK